MNHTKQTNKQTNMLCEQHADISKRRNMQSARSQRYFKSLIPLYFDH